MENLNRTVSEKLKLNHVNDVVNEKSRDINVKLSNKLDTLNEKINGLNLTFGGKVDETKVKSVADKSINYLKVGLQYLQTFISKFSSFVLTAPVLGLLAAIFAIPLFFLLVVFIILSPILVPWILITLTIALVTFLIAASFFLFKIFAIVSVVTIIVLTVKKLRGGAKDRDGADDGKITVDKVVASLTDSAKEYVELVKKGYATTVEYSKTGYDKSVTTVKGFVEKRKGGVKAEETKPEDVKPEEPEKAEPEAEIKPEEEKKNE
ncbi:hypothetical protein H8356DRAFT_1635976 [Neocallimastix lanati (nom. inval.)]|jgi:hypothetical protein|uniref:Uncharacterized protein n=1 Tax=Neocallimastix californiae TaxID=1754190 RepID=A0A1Y2EST8_9FUNG|nr:hypothetical protein H8356DRAFT_1635976 [Neocallimastix sp. JGI-2020a]ORY74216.1 hypothetical protein LY90DRAFT_502722 [Neocallimastix californiae]|eukprot:ORY74216.1 hypothetical protein LY90DRAFT_502722 [Neocallimastix californiae]